MRLKDCFDKGLLRKTSFPRTVVEKELYNANRHLENAVHCLDEEMYDLSIVSSYTSMFHAARAILFRDGIKERSHVCIGIYLKEKYPILAEYVRVLDNYRKSRHTMLYGIDVDVIKEDAIYGIKMAEQFIEIVKKELGV